MKWRFGAPGGYGDGRYLWARGPRPRLYRIVPDDAGGWWVPGQVQRTYRTAYGARMAADALEWKRRGLGGPSCLCWSCRSKKRGRFLRGMALCPICGNKRCPHATHHGNGCTGSNARGQKGSRFA